MVESKDDNPLDKSLCLRCGKSKGTTVSGSSRAWTFKANRCNCSDTDLRDSAPLEPTELEGPVEEPAPLVAPASPPPPAPKVAPPPPPPEPKSVPSELPRPTAFKGPRTMEDSGGWANDPVLRPDSQTNLTAVPDDVDIHSVTNEDHDTHKDLMAMPDFPPKDPATSTHEDIEVVKDPTREDHDVPAPLLPEKPNSATHEDHDVRHRQTPGAHGEQDSWISLGGIDDDLDGPVAEDFNRPMVYEVDKNSNASEPSRAPTKDASKRKAPAVVSSGNLGKGATTVGSFKETDTTDTWVPVPEKQAVAAKSAFADNTRLYDLTHQTDTAEKTAGRPDTRQAIQQAFRRNRIKAIVSLLVIILLAYVGFHYYSKTDAYKKQLQAAKQSISGLQSKKSRSKKNKRTK